jgi:hypothetical protein
MWMPIFIEFRELILYVNTFHDVKLRSFALGIVAASFLKFGKRRFVLEL